MGRRFRTAKAWIADTFAPLRPLYDAWMVVVAWFSWVTVRVGLTVAFVTVFTLYGVVLRVTNRDPLERTLRPESETYWGSYTVTNDDMDSFGQMY